MNISVSEKVNSEVPQIVDKTIEKKASDPKISVHIAYGFHDREEDFKDPKERIKTADIYIPEGVGWTPGILNTLKRVSKGEIDPGLLGKEKFEPSVLETANLIYNTNVPIAFVDIPLIHYRYLLILKELIERGINLKFGPDSFKDNIVLVRKRLVSSASQQEKREKFMARRIKPAVKRLLQEHPHLKDKNELRVLMSLGSGHTNLFLSLDDKDFKVTRSFNYLPIVFGSDTEARRRYIFGKEVDNRLIARVCLEAILQARYPGIKTISSNTEQYYKFIRKVSSQFSFEEIKSMFEEVSTLYEFPKVLLRELHKKGIYIPESQEEMDAFLARPISRLSHPSDNAS